MYIDVCYSVSTVKFIVIKIVLIRAVNFASTSHSLQQSLGHANKSAETRHDFMEDFVK